MSIAMVDVFGFQIMNPLDHVLKACPTDFMEDLYKDHHGKELA